MNITKLPSGSYRIRKMENGRTYSVTVPYKPGKKEADALIREKISGADVNRNTFWECAEEYVSGKAHTLSPATIRGYTSIIKMLPEKLKMAQIGSLTAWDVQKYVDQLVAEGKSPKTVRNYHGFISAVLATFAPDTTISTKLPQKTQEADYVPSDDDVKRILDMAKGTDYEIPLRLACYGLRRSEICALTLADLDGCMLTINKAKVLGTDRTWYIKTTKTTSSTRTIMIDDDLATLIRETGKVYDVYPNRIYWFLQKCQDNLGIPHFPLHYLRHYYASTAHALGIPDAVIMETGGWKTDHVMKRVYRHAKDTADQQAKLIAHMTKLS